MSSKDSLRNTLFPTSRWGGHEKRSREHILKEALQDFVLFRGLPEIRSNRTICPKVHDVAPNESQQSGDKRP